MAGYSKLYCIGGLGGFMGADGINPITLQILVGDADRQWLEPHYFDKRLKPIGNIRTIIPEGPNHPNSLVDACIAFSPKFFENCSSLTKVKIELQDNTCLDFHLGLESIPLSWFDLRKEAIPYFKKLNIFEANLTQLDLENHQL